MLLEEIVQVHDRSVLRGARLDAACGGYAGYDCSGGPIHSNREPSSNAITGTRGPSSLQALPRFRTPSHPSENPQLPNAVTPNSSLDPNSLPPNQSSRPSARNPLPTKNKKNIPHFP